MTWANHQAGTHSPATKRNNRRAANAAFIGQALTGGGPLDFTAAGAKTDMTATRVGRVAAEKTCPLAFKALTEKAHYLIPAISDGTLGRIMDGSDCFQDAALAEVQGEEEVGVVNALRLIHHREGQRRDRAPRDDFGEEKLMAPHPMAKRDTQLLMALSLWGERGGGVNKGSLTKADRRAMRRWFSSLQKQRDAELERAQEALSLGCSVAVELQTPRAWRHTRELERARDRAQDRTTLSAEDACRGLQNYGFLS